LNVHAEGIMEQGLLPWFAIKGFQSGNLSLGQLSKALGKNQHETIKYLPPMKQGKAC
jgi:predicted HTH domain antitoxin